ncbi:MAG: tyrosine-type recombinase/integrase [Pseudomonadota bacterium]
MTFSLVDIEVALENSSHEVQSYASHARKTLEKHCVRAFSQEKLPADYLSKNARAVYKEAGNYKHLIALQKSLWSLYCFAQPASPQLIPPFQFFPTAPTETPVLESSPSFALQEALNDAVDKALSSNNVNILLIAHALKLAKRLKITSTEKFTAVLSHTDDELSIFNDLTVGVMSIDGTRYYLDATSMLHLHQIKRATFTIKSLKTSFANFLSEATPSPFLDNCSLEEALNALSFDIRAMARNNLLSSAEPLSTSSLIKVLSGHSADEKEITNGSTEYRRKRKLDIKQSNTDEIEFFNQFQRLAFDDASSSADEYILKRFSLILEDLKHQNPQGKRNTKAFELAQKNLMALLCEAQSGDADMSYTAYLLLYYLTDIFLSGTKFGNKLAVSSVLTYRSTLLSFVRDVWINDDELQLAQSNDDVLMDLSELAADALSDRMGQDKQSTIINFLSFINEVSQYKHFDSGEMEFLGAPVTSRRPHYITQSDFEAACAQFINEENSKERRLCALKMKLCYYGALRSSEADNLLANDIDVDTDTLYVSRLIRRKSLRAVRRVPLCFFPTSTLNEIAQQTERVKSPDDFLLEYGGKSYLEKKFIDLLREQCSDRSLVIHSLRHSAANNMLYLLSMAIFHRVHACRHNVFFLSQSLFNDDQLQRIRFAFKEQGRDLNPYFPVLDALATYLGHVCAAVTVSNYLHLLDLLLFIIEQDDESTPTPCIKSVLASNNHQFQQLKRYENAANTSAEAANNTLFKIATHGINAMKRYDKVALQLPETDPAKISFRQYLTAIEDYQTSSLSSILTDELKAHLYETGSEQADVSFITSLSSREFPTFLRFCERITHTPWNKKNIHAFKTFLNCLEVNKITRERDLTRYLRALDLIGLKEQRIQIDSANNERSEVWSSHIEDFGHTAINIDSKSPSTVVAVKPVYCRYSLWHQLKLLISLVLNYTELKEH